MSHEHKASWMRFIRERHLLVLEWAAQGKSVEYMCMMLSVTPVEIDIIVSVPGPTGEDRYDPNLPVVLAKKTES